MSAIDSIWADMQADEGSARSKHGAKAKTGYLSEKECGASRDKDRPKKGKKSGAKKVAEEKMKRKDERETKVMGTASALGRAKSLVPR